MTTQAEAGIVVDIISLIVQAEDGRSPTDIAMPTLIQGVLDEITVNIGYQGGFAYLLYRAGKAGVDFDAIMDIIQKGKAVFCMLPQILYEAVSNGVNVSSRALKN